MIALAFAAPPPRAQETKPAPVAPVAPSPPAPPALAPALTEYLGRTIAPTMSYEAGPWLQRAEREKEESCSKLLEALHLQEGQVVADIGCGNGFYTLKIAPRLGPKGRIYAVDIQREMLDQLKELQAQQKVAGNVVPVQSSVVDPKLPAASVDLALLVDVYHEFDHPVEMLAALKQSLKPGGRIVLVEFRLEDPEVPIKLLHRMSKVQMKKELAANGFVVAEEFDGLPWQHVVFFAAAPKDGAKDGPKDGKKDDVKNDPKDGKKDGRQERGAAPDRAARGYDRADQ